MLVDILKKVLIPKYDELSVYLIASFFVLVYAFYPEVRQAFFDTPASWSIGKELFWYLMLLTLAFMVFLSISHAFFEHPKTEKEKECMLFVAVFVSVGTGIAAADHMLKESGGQLVLFPLWNLLNAMLLLGMHKTDILTTKDVADDDATPFQVALASAVSIPLFLACKFVFELHWTEVFSISVVYATNLDRVVQFAGASLRGDLRGSGTEPDDPVT